MSEIKTEALFDYLFEQGFQPEYYEEDTEIVVCCNLCGDDRPRLYINSDTGAWVCFHCGESGGLHRLLLAVCELNGHEAFELGRTLRNREADDIRDYFELSIKKEDPVAMPVVLPQQMHAVDESTPALFSKYLARRHVSLELARARGIGYCVTGRYAYRIVIPVENDGHLYTFIARSVLNKCPTCTERLDACTCRPRQFPKVLTPKGGHPRLTVFNFDHVRRSISPRVVIVEGVFDALRCPTEAVALLGSSASPTQLALVAGLSRGREVVIALDGDEAGYRGAAKLADALTSELVKVRVALLPTDSDPGSMDKEELDRCLESALRYVI